MPAKVCFISNYTYRLFNPKSHLAFGGIETIFYLIAKGLAKDPRYKVSFLLEDDVHQSPKTEIINRITLYKTFRKTTEIVYQDKQIQKYYVWFTYLAKKFSRLWQLPHLDFFRLWDSLKRIKSDVYISASPGYESGLITILAKIMRKRSIYIVVNDELFSKNYKKTKDFKDKIYFFGLKHADIVWCFSARHQKILQKKYRIDAINLPCWYPRPKTIFPLKKRKNLLWVGRIESRKQPIIFIKLAKSLPDLQFIMIAAASPNEPDLFKTVVRLAASTPNLKLKQNVMFTKLDQYYQTALAFIDTSDYKNLNMTQVQAACSNVPCLTMFFDPNDSFKNYRWGLSAQGDFKKLIKNTKMALDKPILWGELVKNSHRFAKAVYDPETNMFIFKKLLLRLSR